MASEIIKRDQLEQIKISSKDKLIVIKFFATWCGPCQMLGPIYDELSTEITKDYKLVSVNVDDSPEFSQEFGITSLPTIIILKEGKEINRTMGFLAKPQLTSFIEKTK